MADKKMEVSVILSAYDRMTRVVNAASNNAIKKMGEIKNASDKMSKDAFSFGAGSLAVGAAGAGLLAGPVMAFGNMEEAALSLKSVMMKDGGVLNTKQFDQISKLSNELGNKLPGNTQDFYEMFDTMIRNGVPAENILQGVGKSAAYLAVALKLPYSEAGQMAAKLKEATGVADKDMMAFMDTIARTNQLGVKSGEMQFAFGRSAGALKLMQLQGLESAKSLSAVYAILMRTNSGETVGTGMSAILNSFMNSKKMAALQGETQKLGITMDLVDKQTGKFKGVENMIAQFDQLNGLNPQQRANIVQAFLGPGADASMLNTLIDKGVGGYNEMVDQMKTQASLNSKVESQLRGQKAMWEAASGTFSNIMAMVGDLVSDDIKKLFDTLNNNVLPAVSSFIDKNRTLVKVLVIAISVISAVAIALGTIGIVSGIVLKSVSLMTTGFGVCATVMKWIQFQIFALRFHFAFTLWPAIVSATTAVWGFTAALLANPITWIVVGIMAFAAAAVWVYKNWDMVKAFFIKMWEVVKATFSKALGFIKNLFLKYHPLGIIINNWDAILTFMKSIGTKFFNAGANIAKSIWNGIKSMASKPIEEIAKMTQKMREYLPFSPAKKGAFMDLHKVKIVETIAGTMRSAPLAKAMDTATRGAMKSKGGSAGGSGGGSITINYNPVINGAGGSDDIKKVLKENADYLVKLIESKMASKARLSFS
jgi:TP901 family phage tail tape measure protein